MKVSKILKIVGVLFLIIICGLIYVSFLNPASPRGSSELVKESLVMEVDYSRPFKKERLIFGELSDGALVPFNNYWRLGANFATTFETNESIFFELMVFLYKPQSNQTLLSSKRNVQHCYR